MTCWCSNTNLQSFNEDYALCEKCGTLISLKGISQEKIHVVDDNTDYYGKNYWLNDTAEESNTFPDIFYRSRLDPTERNLHWLKTLLKYLHPPAKILEIGAGCGSFVAMLNQIGFDAQGMELSPWVVDYAKEQFKVPMTVGTIEQSNYEPQSFDAIVLMDVFEHLSNPVQTLQHCLKLLKPEGFLLMQTPQFQPDINYEELVKTNAPFLSMLVPEGHLYLFSQASIKHVLAENGCSFVAFEPSIFVYDMTVVASRQTLQAHDWAISEAELLKNPQKRFILALLDLRAREQEIIVHFNEAATSRDAYKQEVQHLKASMPIGKRIMRVLENRARRYLR